LIIALTSNYLGNVENLGVAPHSEGLGPLKSIIGKNIVKKLGIKYSARRVKTQDFNVKTPLFEEEKSWLALTSPSEIHYNQPLNYILDFNLILGPSYL